MAASPTTLPLSTAQQGLWFAHTLAPDIPCHATAEVVELTGSVDAERLRAAHAAAYREFEQLRASFHATPDGPRQVIGEPVVTWAVVDAADDSEAEAWLRADLARPDDLGAGPPVRAALLRLPDGRCWWYHRAHHVVLDGYGAQQLLRRIAQLHDDPHAAGGDPTPGLAEVVAEDAALADDPEADGFWEQRLQVMDEVVSISGRVADPAPAAVRRRVALDDGLQHDLADAARRLGVSWSDLVSAAVGSYQARVTDRPGTRIGLPLMNRSQPGRGRLTAASTVCTAMNVLPVTVPGTGTVADVVAAAAGDQRAVRRHPFLRQEELTRRLRRKADGQLFGLQLNLLPFDLELTLGGVPGVVRNLTAGPVEDLTVCLRGTPARGRPVWLEFDANPRLYAEDDLDLHLERLVAWLATWAAADPEAEVGTLPLATPAELARIATFNDTRVPHTPRTLARRFHDQVARTPDAPALLHGVERRSYAELDTAARRVVAALRKHGVRAGQVVGVRLERSCALFETLWGIQLLGAVHLPLDPDLPEARLQAMLDDAGCSVVVATRPGPEATTVLVDTCARATPVTDVEPPDDTDAAAYLLFTSGSTGRPKGVLVGQAAIDNRLTWMQAHFALRPGERVLHKTPISFDVSVWELFWPHQVGGCVVIADPGDHRDPRALATTITEHDVAVLHFVPSMLRAFLADRNARTRVGGADVRAVVCSGEALTPDLVRGCTEAFGVAPTNLYGPTEAAVDVTCWECDPDDTGPVPIGRPIANTTCHVLSADGAEQPIGVVGELWLGGVQLADGYVGRADLTAERFREVPGIAGRLYRTGDLAAWRSDGALRYLGRTDDQVKVRGMRVELGEIEHVLSTARGVDGVTVGLVDDRLTAWYVATAPDAVTSLQGRAAEALPDGWAPAHWVEVPRIPLGTSGKADRRRLARDHPPLVDVGGDAGPSTWVEQQVGDLVATVLDLDRVPVDADFFDLGGDSLSALRLVAGLGDDLGVEASLADVFDHPNVRALAELVVAGGSGRSGFEPVLQLRVGDPERSPLVLLPPAGGLGWCWTGLLRSLPADLPVIALQAPGIATGEPASAGDLDELARRQLEQIRSRVGLGRFHVAGWSLGGMAAQAVAAIARAEGQEVGTVTALDAYPSEQWSHLPEPDEAEALRGVLRMGGAEPLLGDETPTRARVAELLRDGGSAIAALPDDVLSGCITSVVDSAAVVRGSEHRVMPGDLHLVAATAPREETWLEPAGWKAHIDGELFVHELPVTHGALLRRPAVDEVGALLAELIGADHA